MQRKKRNLPQKKQKKKIQQNTGTRENTTRKYQKQVEGTTKKKGKP